VTETTRLQPCEAWLSALSALVDGELPDEERVAVQRHVAVCAACEAGVEAYRALGAELRALPAPLSPPELGLRLRVAASHHSVQNRQWLYWRLRWQTWAEALALPTALGTALAMGLFFALAGGVRVHVSANSRPDVEVGFGAQPPRVASLSDYQVGSSLLIEASIDPTGHVYGYRVLSGYTNPQIISRLNTQLLLSAFEPATTMFGQPTSGSLLVSFGTVDVKG